MSEDDSHYLIERFEDQLRQNQAGFFDVDELEEIADYYLETGQLQRALLAIDMGGDLHPYATTFAVKRARYFVASHQLDLAKEAIQTAEGLSPNHPDLEWVRGQLLMRLGKNSEAIASLRKALQAAEDPFPIQAHLASLYTAIGQFHHAVKVLKAMLREEPKDDHLLYMLAANFDMAGHDDKAVEWFKLYLDQYPFSETAWYHLGAAYFRLDELHLALDAMDYALVIDENFTAAHFDRGRILEEKEEYKPAITAFESAIDTDEPNGFTFYRIGICQQALGKDKKAMDAFVHAIKLDEDLDEAWIELAILYGENKRLFEAIQHAKKALSLDPDNPDYYLVAYDLYMQLGLLLEAEKMLKMVLKTLRIEAPAGLLDYAKSLLEMNQTDAAHSVLRMGLERHADAPEMWAIYVGFLFAIQELPMAKQHMREALHRYGSSFGTHLLMHYPKLGEDPEINEELNTHLPQA